MRLCLLTLSSALILACQYVVAQESVVSREYTIKAGVVGVLSKCVVWPEHAAPSPGEPLKIGILGSDPFVENGVNQLERVVAAGHAKGEKIALLRFDSAKDYTPCHILFVSGTAGDHSEEQTVAERIEAVKHVIKDENVLIVGESDGLAQRGVVANLVFDRTTNLIQLEINPDAAARTGLKLTPDLLRLKLVRIVRDSNG